MPILTLSFPCGCVEKWEVSRIDPSWQENLTAGDVCSDPCSDVDAHSSGKCTKGTVVLEQTLGTRKLFLGDKQIS